MLRVGNRQNSINPATGAAEFGFRPPMGDGEIDSFGPPPPQSLIDGMARYDFGLPHRDAKGMTPEMTDRVTQAMRTVEPPKLPAQTMSPGAFRPNKSVNAWDSFVYGLGDGGAELAHMGYGIFSPEKADAMMAAREAEIENGRWVAGRTGEDYPRMAGQAAFNLLLPGIRVGKFVGKIGVDAVEGAIEGALKPTEEPYSWEKVRNIAEGAAESVVQGTVKDFFGKELRRRRRW